MSPVGRPGRGFRPDQIDRLTQGENMSVVAISREVGSLGDEIAALVADKLNFQLADQAKIHDLARSCDREYQDACRAYEDEIPHSFLERLFFDRPAYASLFHELTYDLASQGDVVMLGRGSQIILGGFPGVLKCRVVCPLEIRARRVAEAKGIEVDQAVEYIHSFGHRRRSMIESIFEKDLNDWYMFDLILNTAAYSLQDAAEVVCEAFRRLDYPDPAETRHHLARLAFAKKVEVAVRKKVATTPFRHVDVTPGPGEGAVELNGYVLDKASLEQAEAAAWTVAGVKGVVNNLRTTELTF